MSHVDTAVVWPLAHISCCVSLPQSLDGCNGPFCTLTRTEYLHRIRWRDPLVYILVISYTPSDKNAVQKETNTINKLSASILLRGS